MFTAALLTIANIWKQPKCPLTDEWIKKIEYVYTMQYYLPIKKNEIMQQDRFADEICSNIDGPRDDHTKYVR